MNFKSGNASIYYPGVTSLDGVTDMCIAAHQDDVEIMAYAPIAACYGKDSFAAVVVTDGAGSPRAGEYADYTDEQMKAVRITEQQQAANIGKYRAAVLLGYPSAAVKDGKNADPVDDIYELLMAVRPRRLYTHNVADKHPTHVAVALRVIAAVKRMPKEARPESFTALEVWRGLDWMCDGDKVCLDTGAYPELAEKLLQVHRSQVVGGKRYDTAAIGRRFANATFFESHATDDIKSMNFGMDLMPMVERDVSPLDYVMEYIDRFVSEVSDTVGRLM